MNIFFVVRGYPSRRDPTWGIFELEQAEALADRGHNVTMLAVDTRFRLYPRRLGIHRVPLSDSRINAYEMFWIPWKLSRIISRPLVLWIFRRFLAALYKKAVGEHGAPDVVYAHYLPNMEMAVGLKQKYGVRVVGMEHWSELGKEHIKPDVQRHAQVTYPKLDGLIAVSDALAQNVKRVTGVDSVVVNNMVGRLFTYRERVRQTGDAEVVQFIAIGNLIEIKGFNTLLYALQRVNEKCRGWRLRIIGEGALRHQLEALAQSLGLGQQVELVGKQMPEDIVRMLGESDLFVLSSTSETFGVVAIEALAVGLPIVATDCGGPREYVTKENGVLTPVGDAERMASSLHYMMEHLGDYDRQQISRECLRRYSRAAIAEKIEKVLEKSK
ncbi:MAG: glycosyltransferase [Bacteroidales bacterium]|nr:glycosyltransferase [Bacteroidales bacterium]